MIVLERHERIRCMNLTTAVRNRPQPEGHAIISIFDAIEMGAPPTAEWRTQQQQTQDHAAPG